MSAMYPDELGPFEWGRWFRSLSDDEATDVARKILTRMKHDTRCFQADHLGQIEAMRAEIARLLAMAPKTDEACGVMLLLVTDGRETVHVCARDPHDRGRHKTYAGVEWEIHGEDQPVTRAASR